jgi:hypothetical protein
MDDENIRRPDVIYRSRMIDEITLEEMIQNLIDSGLSIDEAEIIAAEQYDNILKRKRELDNQHIIENSLKRNKLEENIRREEINSAIITENKYKETKFAELSRIINEYIRRFSDSTQDKLKLALESNLGGNKLEISDHEFNNLSNEIDNIVKRTKLSEQNGQKILDLFTTPVMYDDDTISYHSSDNEGYGIRKRRRTNKIRKTRRTRKTRKTKRTRRIRKK